MAARVGLRQRLFDKTSPLPPQVSLRHISAISICSVVGTGVYISSLSTSLRDAGPAGVLIAYALTATIVYCTAVSNGEMMAHLPNVGGPVGLADVFVDPALGFAMGWNAWYHWSIIVPTQLAAAGRLAKSYVSSQTPVANSTFYASISLFLVLAVGLNFLGARRFGQVHVAFALLKMGTLVVLVFVALIIDWTPVRRCNAFPGSTGCPAPDVPNTCAREFALPLPEMVTIGGAYWQCPGPFVQPYGTHGLRGSIAGVFTVLVQACFSFFGTEIAGVPGREIQNPTTNIPRAIRRVWFRITLLYILAVLAAGLVVPSNDRGLAASPIQSPWILALHIASATTVPRYLLYALFMLSAFSAASSDVYVSSRYLFYLARRGHAPWIFGSVYKGKPKGALPAFGERRQGSGGSVMRERTPGASPAMLSRSLSDVDVAKDAGSPPGMHSPTSPPSTLPLLHYSHSPSNSYSSSPPHSYSLSPPISHSHSHSHSPSHSRDLSADFLSPHSLSGTIGLSMHTRHGSQLSGSFSLPVTPPRATAHALGAPLTVDTLTSRPNTGQSAATLVSHSSPAVLSSASPRPPRLKRSKAIAPEPPPDIFVPWVGVLAAGLIGLLVFLAPAAQNDKKVDAAFKFFTQMTNCACLISWVGILVTYLRYYQGTQHAEANNPAFREQYRDSLYANRPWGQPWLARYALVWCIAILLGQGWTSFTSPGVNRIAELDGDAPVKDTDFDLSFIVNYLPIASFLLLAFGYKLVYQTNFVRLEDMKFERGKIIEVPEEREPRSGGFWMRLYRFVL